MLETHRTRLANEGAITLVIRARPNARVTAITGAMDDGALKIGLHAAPEDGEANAGLVALLAREFGVSKTNVEIVSGHASRRKVIRITRAG